MIECGYRLLRVLASLADGDRIGSVLFVKTVGGRPMSSALVSRIRQNIQAKLSKRHVPAKIIQCPGEQATISSISDLTVSRAPSYRYSGRSSTRSQISEHPCQQLIPPS